MPIHDSTHGHWYLSVLNIPSGRLSFYDNLENINISSNVYFTHLKEMIAIRFPLLLKCIGWFEANNVDETTYKITFHHPPNVPQQAGCFGDCGPPMLMFMKTLLRGSTVNLVDDTIELGRRARETMLEELYDTVVPFDPSVVDDEVTPISLVPFPIPS